MYNSRTHLWRRGGASFQNRRPDLASSYLLTPSPFLTALSLAPSPFPLGTVDNDNVGRGKLSSADKNRRHRLSRFRHQSQQTSDNADMATVVVVAKPIQPKQKLKLLKQGVKKKLISSNSN